MFTLNRVDEEFVSKLLNPNYRKFCLPRLRRSRNIMYVIVLFFSAFLLVEFFLDKSGYDVGSGLGLPAFMLLVYLVIAYDSDVRVKAFLVADKPGLTAPDDAENVEDEAKWAGEFNRRKVFVFVFGLALISLIIGFAMALMSR